MRYLSRLAPILALTLPLWAADAVSAQSVTSASVAGTVTDPLGRPLARVVVGLEAVGAGTDQETTTRNDGSYRFSLVAPGNYELRAEAIGFRPLVARTLRLAGGDVLHVVLPLQPATPPVITVDTIALEAASASRTRPGGILLGSDEIDQIPHRYEDLASIVGLSTQFDETLGSQGLPGSMTVVVADGLPVYRARQTVGREERPADGFLPRPFLSGVTALHHAPDAEWAGAAGGFAAVGTRAEGGASGVAVEGAWGGGPLWSSEKLGLDPTPGLTSFQGSGRAVVSIKPDTTQLLLGSEVLRHESPVVGRISSDLQAGLAGVEPDLLVALGAPSVEQLARYSGLARFYTQPSETSRVFLRGTVSYTERTIDGPGPIALGRWGAMGETSTDFSLAGSFVSEYRPGITFEIRGGVSNSARDFRSDGEGLPSAFLIEEGIPLGSYPGAPGESNRTDAVVLPMVRLDLEDRGTLKFGLPVRASRFSMTAQAWGTGDFLFSDPAALVAGTGYARSSSIAEASFATRELGVFGQYDVAATAGLEISLAAGLDYEMLPTAEPDLSSGWVAVSGLENNEYPDRFAQLQARAAIFWDPTNTGRTRISAVASLHAGDVDPNDLFEAFARDGSSSTTSFYGSSLGWPEGSIPAGADRSVTLTLLGPDTRPPRSLRASLGVVRDIAGGLSLHVSGDYRRTDFLTRRRDLNLQPLPQTTDQFTRGVYGSLSKTGALLQAPMGDARRFPAFGHAWALDPDGWSEYRGMTAGLEFRSEPLDLFGSFTRSETRDNWIGAAAGAPEAELSPNLPSFVEEWDVGLSDFDVPDRITGSGTLRVPGLPGTSLSVLYQFASGRPFTPGYRRGVDANGDGSFENDVPFVPQPADLGALLEEWPCLANQAGGFAVRNSCRTPARHTLDARLRIGLGRIGGQNADIFVDGLNLLEANHAYIDTALLLIDPSAPIVSGANGITVPVVLNTGFGDTLLETGQGRMLRVGMRIGG